MLVEGREWRPPPTLYPLPAYAPPITVYRPPSTVHPSASTLSSGSRFVGQGAECCRIVHGEVGEHLSIELDAGLFQSADKCAVVHVVLVRGRIDAGDPEATEIALLHLAIA